MAQFDVYANRDGQLLLDCQADALANLSTRLVAPLVPVEDAPSLRPRLNPVFDLDGRNYALITQFAAAVSRTELQAHVASLARHRYQIISAYDMMLTGV